MKKIDLKGLPLEELEELIESKGWEKYRAKQVMRWIYKGVSDFKEMTNLPQKLRGELKEWAYIGNIKIVKKHVSKTDHTTKYLFKLDDGSVIESVYMKYSYGNIVCVSSQVGCNMGCRFCASAIGGCIRNLSASEMIDQVLKVQKDQRQKITHVVVMGSGEPLLNYDEVIKFLKVLNSPLSLNISFRRMTVSTCGIVPVIYELADENLPITLSVSLHAPTDSLRNRMMPINKKFPLHELIKAAKFYVERTGRRITFEYVLIKDLNDSKLCAKNLVKLIKDINCHVNLIPVNPVAERNIERPKPETINEFKRLLEQNNIKVTVRRELGQDIDAACGQLRRKMLKEGVINPL